MFRNASLEKLEEADPIITFRSYLAKQLKRKKKRFARLEGESWGLGIIG